MNFADIGLSPQVLKAVTDVGYATPTPIQAQAIPYVLMGRDVLGCAQTGTGKTAAFTIPMIDILASGRARARMPRSLIIAPTRELAAQVSESFERYGKYSNLSMALLIGGSSFVEQEKKLDRGVDVLIATPGRLLDLFERGKILLADAKILVIDEADRMLDMGFIPDVERIVGLLPKIRQTLFFSATMAPEIRRLADAFLMNPKEISVDPPTSAAETVTQALLKVSGGIKEKRAALRNLINHEDVASALIFCNRKRDVDIVFKSLKKHNFSVAAMHGDMAQPVRMETLDTFKNGGVRLLVCSDVAARGLDIPVVSHVFNFDVPINAEDYIHRIGRTGRAGRSGKAFTLALPEENRSLAAVVELISQPIPEVDLEAVAGWGAEDVAKTKKTTRRGSRKTATKTARTKTKTKTKTKSVAEKPEEVAEKPDVAAHEETATPAAKSRRRSSPKPRAKNAAKTPAKVPAKIAAKVTALAQPTATKTFGEHTPAFMLRPVNVA